MPVTPLTFQPVPQNYIKINVNKLNNIQFHGILKHLASGFSLGFISIKIIDMGICILGKSWKFSVTEEGKTHLMRVHRLFITLREYLFLSLD